MNYTGVIQLFGGFLLFQLAKHGMKVVLISRSQDKLNQVSSEISKFFTHPLILLCLQKENS